MEIGALKNILEAALLAADEPLNLNQMEGLFAEDATPGHKNLRSALAKLEADYEGRGIELKEVASGWRIQVRESIHPWVSKLWQQRPPRYSRALLETLAIIAYRQPITRGEIEEIRGVAVSTNIMRVLQEREWVRVVGQRDVPGKPSLFGTTKKFLDYFNLRRLDELPTLAEIREIGDIDPELRFADEASKTQPPVTASADAGNATEENEHDAAERQSVDESQDEVQHQEERKQSEDNREKEESQRQTGEGLKADKSAQQVQAAGSEEE